MPARASVWLLLSFCAPLSAVPLAAPLAAPPVAASSNEAEAALQAGQRRLQAGDLQGAEAAWRQGLAQGEDSGLIYALGGLLFQAGRLREAEESFQRLVQRTPDLADGWYQLGLVRAARGHYKEAVDAQRLAVAHAPNFGQAYCALALDLRETGQGAEAMQAVQKAMLLLPRYAGALNLRGNLKQDQGDLEGAAQDYVGALRLESRYAGAWVNLGELQEKRGQKAEAIKSYSYAIQVQPDYGAAWSDRGELHLETKDLAAAEEDFRQMTRIPDGEADGWWGLTRVMRARAEKAEAAECLVRYRSAVRRRDRKAEREKAEGVERPSAFEPGLPLALSQAPLGAP